MSHVIGESLLPEFDTEMDHTRRILERVPELEGAFTPHPKSMTLRRLAGHVAEMPLWAEMTLGHDEVDLRPDGDYVFKAYELTRTADALAYFDCELTDRLPAGDHELMLGRVVDGGIIDPNGVPMTYRETGDMDRSSTLYPARF